MLTTALALSAAWARNGMATANLPSPNASEYTVYGGESPFEIWPTGQGYCYLSGVNVGYGPTVNDNVGVYADQGHWWVYASGTSSTRATATCVPWPAGYSQSDDIWGVSLPATNLSNNTAFCSLAGILYNGNTHGNVTNWQISGYPTTNVSAVIQEAISNDVSANYPPRFKIGGQCLTPGNSSSLFWGGHVNIAPGQTVTTTQAATVYNGSNTVNLDGGGPGTLCAPIIAQVATGNGGPMAFDVGWTGTNWALNVTNASVYAACIAYPGPVIQMGAGLGNQVLQYQNGPPWAADYNASGGLVLSTTNIISTGAVPSPPPMAVYQHVRYNNGGTFSYTFSGFAPMTSHKIRLHFADAWANAVGQRLFNVTINGYQVLTNFDVFRNAGANNAIAETFNSLANSNGTFTISFTAVAWGAIVSGIEIQ